MSIRRVVCETIMEKYNMFEGYQTTSEEDGTLCGQSPDPREWLPARPTFRERPNAWMTPIWDVFSKE
ncbi:hypothetical protein KCU59_g97, partial [Aureobasidium melanogenum]